MGENITQVTKTLFASFYVLIKWQHTVRHDDISILFKTCIRLLY